MKDTPTNNIQKIHIYHPHNFIYITSHLLYSLVKEPNQSLSHCYQCDARNHFCDLFTNLISDPKIGLQLSTSNLSHEK